MISFGYAHHLVTWPHPDNGRVTYLDFSSLDSFESVSGVAVAAIVIV